MFYCSHSLLFMCRFIVFFPSLFSYILLYVWTFMHITQDGWLWNSYKNFILICICIFILFEVSYAIIFLLYDMGCDRIYKLNSSLKGITLLVGLPIRVLLAFLSITTYYYYYVIYVYIFGQQSDAINVCN